MQIKIKKIYQIRLNELKALNFIIEKIDEEYDYSQIFPESHRYEFAALCGDSYGPEYFRKLFNHNHFRIILYAHHMNEIIVNKLKLLGYRASNKYLYYDYAG